MLFNNGKNVNVLIMVLTIIIGFDNNTFPIIGNVLLEEIACSKK